MIEIEEGELEPKDLLGDIFANIMSNHFQVKIEGKKTHFNITPKTNFIIASEAKKKGKKQEKTEKIITERLSQFTFPSDTIQLENISFIFGENVDVTIENLTSEMKRFFH